MFEPESERDRLLQQQSGVLIFAAAVETAQHQKKIDDIGFGAGPACLQFDVIDFEFAQLKLQFGQIRGLARHKLCVGKAQQLSFWRAGPDLHRCAPQWRAPTGRFGEFRSENRSIGCRSESERLTVEVGWPDQERLRAVFCNSLICSQSRSYRIPKRHTRINSSTRKKKRTTFSDYL